MLSWSPPYLPPLHYDFPSLELRDSYSRKLHRVSDSGIYVCGITPYDSTHLGHAATYITFDLIARYLIASGKSPKRTQNVTDIDDPLLERANRDGFAWTELSTSQIQLFRDDMTSLRVIPPSHYLGVVENMNLILGYIGRLVNNGVTYDIDGDIYLDLSLVPGALEKLPQSLPESIEIFRTRGGDPDRAGKRHPLDTLIWMKNRVGEPYWEGPYGRGRPGWHIECVALALSSLDEGKNISIAIQGGGNDLRFPHHYMTGVQALALTSKQFSEIYVHTGMIGLNGEKMSKSRGNLIFVSKLLRDGVDSMALRLALMNRRYSEDFMWNENYLSKAVNFLARLRSALSREESAPTLPVITALTAALSQDLDTPRALGEIEKWCHRSESGEIGGNPGELSRAIDALLGLAL
jgi:L-cysteine:1D-myo-inositol 2-amino-2-deoxy-alpha-D-glucopyranoside ligase